MVEHSWFRATFYKVGYLSTVSANFTTSLGMKPEPQLFLNFGFYQRSAWFTGRQIKHKHYIKNVKCVPHFFYFIYFFMLNSISSAKMLKTLDIWFLFSTWFNYQLVILIDMSHNIVILTYIPLCFFPLSDFLNFYFFIFCWW